MNWLLIAVLGVLAAFALKGHHDGFIKTVFSIFTIFVSLTLSASLGPWVGKQLQKNDKLMTHMTKQISKTFEMEGEVKGKGKSAVKTKDKQAQEEWIKQLKLPKSLTNALLENNNSEVYKAMAANGFADYISRYLTVIILNAAGFILVFLISGVLLFILAHALNLLSRLPIINGLNKTAGLLVGILNGFVVIWILCIVLTMFSSTSTGRMLYGYINESTLLSSIYNNNLLLRAVMNLARSLF